MLVEDTRCRKDDQRSGWGCRERLSWNPAQLSDGGTSRIRVEMLKKSRCEGKSPSTDRESLGEHHVLGHSLGNTIWPGVWQGATLTRPVTWHTRIGGASLTDTMNPGGSRHAEPQSSTAHLRACAHPQLSLICQRAGPGCS